MSTVQFAAGKAEAKYESEEAHNEGIDRVTAHGLAVSSGAHENPLSLKERVSSPEQPQQKMGLSLPTVDIFSKNPSRKQIPSYPAAQPVSSGGLSLPTFNIFSNVENSTNPRGLSFPTLNFISSPQPGQNMDRGSMVNYVPSGETAMTVSTHMAPTESMSHKRMTHEIGSGALSVMRDQEVSNKILGIVDDTQNMQQDIVIEARAAIATFKRMASAADEKFHTLSQMLLQLIIDGKEISQERLNYATIAKNLVEATKANAEASARQMFVLLELGQQRLWVGHEEQIKSRFSARMKELELLQEGMSILYKHDGHIRQDELVLRQQRITEDVAKMDQILKLATTNADLATKQFKQELELQQFQHQTEMENLNTFNTHELALNDKELEAKQFQHQKEMEKLNTSNTHELALKNQELEETKANLAYQKDMKALAIAEEMQKKQLTDAHEMRLNSLALEAAKADQEYQKDMRALANADYMQKKQLADAHEMALISQKLEETKANQAYQQEMQALANTMHLKKQQLADAHEVALKHQGLQETKASYAYQKDMQKLANAKAAEKGKRHTEVFNNLIGAGTTVSCSAIDASAKVASSAVRLAKPDPCAIM